MTPDDDITPDAKDWTWVLNRRCPQCGYDGERIEPTDVGAHIRRDADRWTARLQQPGVTVRPSAGVWSVLEYGCHVRDVHRIFNQRVELMLAEEDPTFPNWDQDDTAVADDYRAQEPTVVADQLRQAANAVADTYAAVPPDAWARRGLRSNGSEFTMTSIARYHLHDIVHHAWDVGEEHSA